MRTLSADVTAAIAATATKPGWLVEIAATGGTIRKSSYGTVSWAGYTWTGANMTVSSVASDGKRATISFFDYDAALRVVALTGSGFRNKAIKIWLQYDGLTSPDDPVQVFAGVGDRSSSAKGKLVIDCARSNSRTLMAPRQRMSPASGFNFLAPPGTVIWWGSQKLVLGKAK